MIKFELPETSMYGNNSKFVLAMISIFTLGFSAIMAFSWLLWVFGPMVLLTLPPTALFILFKTGTLSFRKKKDASEV